MDSELGSTPGGLTPGSCSSYLGGLELAGQVSCRQTGSVLMCDGVGGVLTIMAFLRKGHVSGPRLLAICGWPRGPAPALSAGSWWLAFVWELGRKAWEEQVGGGWEGVLGKSVWKDQSERQRDLEVQDGAGQTSKMHLVSVRFQSFAGERSHVLMLLMRLFPFLPKKCVWQYLNVCLQAGEGEGWPFFQRPPAGLERAALIWPPDGEAFFRSASV